MRSSSPGHRVGSARPSCPSCWAPATRWSAWPAPRRRRSARGGRCHRPAGRPRRSRRSGQGGRRLRRGDPPGLPARGGLRWQLRRCGGGRPACRGGHGRGPGRLRPTLRARLGHARADGRPGGHRGRRARPRRGDPGQSRRAPVRPPPCSRCPCGASASARRCCAFRRRSTATATTGSWPPSSTSPASGAWPATWGTEPTAGRPCTAPTPPAWPASPSRRPRPARSCTPSATRALPFRDIAEAMGRHLDVPTASVAPADAAEHFAPLGHFVGLDSPASAAITRELLGWEPTGPEPARGPRAGPLLPGGLSQGDSIHAVWSTSRRRHPA